jgi:hypothetical protein
VPDAVPWLRPTAGALPDLCLPLMFTQQRLSCSHTVTVPEPFRRSQCRVCTANALTEIDSIDSLQCRQALSGVHSSGSGEW